MSLATVQGFCSLSLEMSQQTVGEKNCASKLITTHLQVLSFHLPNLEFNNSRPHFLVGEPAFHEIIKLKKSLWAGCSLKESLALACPSLPSFLSASPKGFLNTLKSVLWAGEVAQLIKCSSSKHMDLNLEPQHCVRAECGSISRVW